MVDDVLGTDIEFTLVVWVDSPALIFDKKDRIECFTDIVIKSTGTGEQRIPADPVNSFLGQIGDHQRMLEGTRSFLGQVAQGRMIRIREFDQCDFGGITENPFKDIDHRVSECQ